MNLSELLSTENKLVKVKRILQNYYSSLGEQNLFLANDSVYSFQKDSILFQKTKNTDNGYEIDNISKMYEKFQLKSKELTRKNKKIFYITYLLIPKDDQYSYKIDTIIYYKKDESSFVKRYMYSKIINTGKTLKRSEEFDINNIDKIYIDNGTEKFEPKKKRSNSEIYKKKKKTKFDLDDSTATKEKLPNLIRFRKIEMD